MVADSGGRKGQRECLLPPYSVSMMPYGRERKNDVT